MLYDVPSLTRASRDLHCPSVVLGVSALAHDPAACLIIDGRLAYAIEEERLARVKNVWGFPHRAIRDALGFAGLRLHDVDVLAYYWDDRGQLPRSLGAMAREISTPSSFFAAGLRIARSMKGPSLLRTELSLLEAALSSRAPPVTFVPHHDAHAHAAWAASAFQPGVALVVDGRGEYAATSVYELPGREGRPRAIERTHFPHSLGVFYGAITQHLGYRAISDEYKIMGLSAWGRAHEHLGAAVRTLVPLSSDGRYRLDLRYFDVGNCSDPRRRWLSDSGVDLLRSSAAGLSEHDAKTCLAFQTQQHLEDALLGLARRAIGPHTDRRLALAGGVALNSRAAGRLRQANIVSELNIPVAPHDSGACLGAAAFAFDIASDNRTEHDGFQSPFLGPSYTNEFIEGVLKQTRWPYRKLNDVARVAAEDLAGGTIFGWFQGRMEFGARALGARSIIGDPRSATVRDEVNAAVKNRELFRPFAPSVLEEEAEGYFPGAVSRYMSEIVLASTLARSRVPAVVHCDGTARPQVVPRSWPIEEFRALIEHFFRLTGVPMVLNTSFNVNDEPLVCSPVDALRCFGGSGLQRLYIGCFQVTK